MFRKADFEAYCKIDEWIELNFVTFDHPTWLSLSAHKKCKYIQKLTAAYRVLPTSISNTANPEKHVKFTAKCAEIEEYIVSKFGYGSISKEKHNHLMCTSVMGEALKYHRCREFCEYARKLIPHTFKEKIMHFLPLFYYLQFTLRH